MRMTLSQDSQSQFDDDIGDSVSVAMEQDSQVVDGNMEGAPF